jgi:predicted nucleic acid-binding protein
MIAYWDTSAVIALIFSEEHSAAAELAKKTTTQYYAWHWLHVEACCAIERRRGGSSAHAKLKLWCADATWLDLPVADHPALLAFNQRHRLRAADAGHLHCFQRAAHVLPDLVLVSFDAELTAAARAEKLRVFSP